MLPAAEPSLVVHVRGVQDNNPPRRFVHEFHTLSILLEGAGSYCNGTCEFPPGRPIFCLTPLGHDDVNGLVGPVEAWYVSFLWPELQIDAVGRQDLKLSWAPGAAGAAGAASAAELRERTELQIPRLKETDAATSARVVQAFAALQASTSRQDPAGRLAAGGQLLQLIALFCDLPAGAPDTQGHRALARFHDLLVEKACAPVTIEDLAAAAGATADHLRDLFRARYGVRPVEFRTAQRLSQARDLLTSTTLNVGEVARRVGYPDPLYFSRAFRKHFGFTPSDLIRRYRLPG